MATLTLNNEEFDAFPPLLKEFASQKFTVENRSEKTVCEYLLDLRTFFRYYIATKEGLPTEGDEFMQISISHIGEADVRAITGEFIYRFLLYSSEGRRNGWAARSRKLSALKAFFKFATVKKHIMEESPTANIDSPKRHSTLPKFLSLGESVSLLEAVQNDDASKTRERDYAIITLFLNCGMRLSELVGINIYDIDKEMRSLRVIGKGHKERIVYLNDACRNALTAYLQVRGNLAPSTKHTHALFLSSRGTRISNKTVQWIVYKYLDAAGLDHRGFSVHKLRHTAATLMYQTGQVDVRVLKDILGHEQLNTTQIYTHVSDAHMEEAVASNPLADVRMKKIVQKESEEA